MKKVCCVLKTTLPGRCAGIILCLLILVAAGDAAGAARGRGRPAAAGRERLRRAPSPRTAVDLGAIAFKIVYETFRKTDGVENWELFMMNADGSDKVNLTNTPDLDEMYPHVSPDASRICFVVDEGAGREKVRNVYYMDIDGTQRVKVAENTREPCWSPDGKKIAYLKGEFERYSTREYATSELMIYDLQTGLHKQHPNKELHHIYAICWSPNGRWFLCAVQGGMGFSDTILAFEADGTKVFDLEQYGVRGCRPDLSVDGKMMTWGETDWELCLGDIDLTGDVPKVTNVRKILGCVHAAKVYHVDFSPDGKYLAFSYGPQDGGQQVGGMAEGWNICVADMTGKWVKVTIDGNHNKEPDWVPIPPAPRAAENNPNENPLTKLLSHPLIQANALKDN
jgi:Tol biopolymer transport system component